MPIQPGTDIGRYHILEQLGEGGMAVVFKAYDTHLKCEVAFKIIRNDKIVPESSPTILKRFKIEAQKTAELTHPNIVPVIDYGEHEGISYLVMKYIAGGTLKQIIGEPIPYKRAIETILPVANALDYAHKNGIVHRDIKPANILITDSGEPMLSDFGIAKILESSDITKENLTLSGIGIGTPEYMAPEQAAGKNVDARTDIYALGIVLYELITGRKPFVADTPLAVIIKQSTDPVPDPRLFIADLPEHVKCLLMKALEKKPEDRFANMRDFCHALEDTLSGKIFGEEPSLYSTSDKTFPIFEQSDQNFPSTHANPTGEAQTRDEFFSIHPKSESLHLPANHTRRKKNRYWGISLASVVVLMGVGVLFLIIGLSKQKSAEVLETVANPPSEFQDAETDGIIELDPQSKQPKSISISGMIQLNNVAQLTEIDSWEGIPATIIAWMSGSQGFYTASEMDYGYSLFHLGSQSQNQYQEDARYIYMAAISSDGKFYATTDQGSQLQVWQPGGSQPKFTIQGSNVSTISPPAFSPDSSILAVLIDNEVQIWSTGDGSLMAALEFVVATDPDNGGARLSLAFSPDGNYLASGNNETGEIKVWDAKNFALVHTMQWHEGVWSLVFSPDGKILSSGSILYGGRENIRFWDTASGNLIMGIQKSNDQVGSIAFSPDGQLLFSGSRSGVVRVWRVLDGSLLTTLKVYDRAVDAMALSPDGKYLLTAAEDLVLWGIPSP